MAAYYPEKPSEEQKVSMRAFLTGLALFYPCSHCAEAFQQDLVNLPPE
jgi:FAD-linked sulfhydryl oxidase